MKEGKVSTETNNEKEEPGGSPFKIFSGPAYALKVDKHSFSLTETLDKHLVV